MSGLTKMIIITSNEDIIRQFSSKKNKDTQIIDLGNDQQVTSIAKNNNNTVNLALLAELSELNSDNDQIYKRVLSSPDHPRTKVAKVSKKSMDLTCTICGDRAIGFNYDVLSCASCKAFFRRNAYQSPEKLRCLTGYGGCSFAHDARRKCPRCRLNRCFAAGMRKDFIQSAEVKLNRKKRLEENRINTSKRLSISESVDSSNSESIFSPASDEIDRFLMDLNENSDNILVHGSIDINDTEDMLFETLSVEDWVIIQTVQSSFLSYFQMPTLLCTNCLDLTDRASALISWSQFASNIGLRFISFFRQIDEFEALHEEDRFILIKYNLLPLFSISKCYNYQATDDCCSCDPCEAGNKHRQFFNLCGGSDDTRQLFVNMVHSLVQVTEQDPTLLALLLIILLFTQGLSMREDEPSLKDPLAVYRAHSHYTKVLWNYMVNKQGEINTYKQFTQLLRVVFQMQSTSKQMRERFLVQFMSADIVDRLAPLMQTLLRIS